MSDVEVVENPAERRFEARLDGELAGFVEYRVGEGVISLIHTEVLPDHEGKGVGGALARQSLDAVRADGALRVRAVCPFIAGWIERHPDYQDLLTDDN